MNKAPTARQAQILSFIQVTKDKTGTCPTHDEIASHFRLKSAFSVRQHLRLLEKKGAIQLAQKKSRSIQISTSIKHSKSGIPLLGRIPAGSLREAIENTDEALPISPTYFPSGQLFALNVQGDSMKDAGIMNGDFAVLRHQPTIEPGEIAAVIVNDEATLKQVIFMSDEIVLRAQNPNFPDVHIFKNEQPEVRIAGKLVGIVRRL